MSWSRSATAKYQGMPAHPMPVGRYVNLAEARAEVRGIIRRLASPSSSTSSCAARRAARRSCLRRTQAMDILSSPRKRMLLPSGYGPGNEKRPAYNEGMAVVETQERHQELIDELLSDVAVYNPDVDRELITRAFRFAARAHEEQQ